MERRSGFEGDVGEIQLQIELLPNIRFPASPLFDVASKHSSPRQIGGSSRAEAVRRIMIRIEADFNDQCFDEFIDVAHEQWQADIIADEEGIGFTEFGVSEFEVAAEDMHRAEYKVFAFAVLVASHWNVGIALSLAVSFVAEHVDDRLADISTIFGRREFEIRPLDHSGRVFEGGNSVFAASETKVICSEHGRPLQDASLGIEVDEGADEVEQLQTKRLFTASSGGLLVGIALEQFAEHRIGSARPTDPVLDEPECQSSQGLFGGAACRSCAETEIEDEILDGIDGAVEGVVTLDVAELKPALDQTVVRLSGAVCDRVSNQFVVPFLEPPLLCCSSSNTQSPIFTLILVVAERA